MGKRKVFKNILLASLVIASFSAAVITQDSSKAVKAEEISYTIPENAFEIRTPDDVKTVFDGGAAFNGRNVVLMNNVDMAGHAFTFNSCAMAGEYAGIFEGQGYTISNYSVRGGLFNIIKSGGIISNLNLEFTQGDFSGSGAIANFNNGTVINCNTVITISKAVNTIGGIALESNGVVEDCSIYFDLQNASANTFFSIARNTTPTSENVINCRYNSNEIGRISANGGTIDPTLDPNAGSEELPTLAAPTNIAVVSEDGYHTLTFTEVEGAANYRVEYRSGTELAGFEIVANSPANLVADITPGEYTIYVKAVGVKDVSNDSEFATSASAVIIVLDSFPSAGLPINIASNSKIEGVGIQIFLADKPALDISDFEIRIVGFESETFAGYKDSIVGASISYAYYITDNGYLYATYAGAGFPDNGDQVLTLRLTYKAEGLTYLEELVFVGNFYDAEQGADLSLGYNFSYGEQFSTDRTSIRYIGKVYLGEKTIADLAGVYSAFEFEIKANIEGERKSTTLTTSTLMTSLNAVGEGGVDAVVAETGWYFFAVIIENIPASANYSTVRVNTAGVPVVVA